MSCVHVMGGRYVYPNVSVGGGQHMTCRDIARIGQLMLNKGRWPASEAASHDSHADKGGKMNQTSVLQLVSEDYMEDLARQNFPQ